MSFTFPASPTTGQIFTPSGGPTYVWNGYGWALQTTVTPSGLVLLNTLIAINSANLTDTTSFTSAYDSYELEIANLVPASTPANIAMQIQIGGSFIATGYSSYVTGAITGGAGLAGTDISPGGSFLLSGNGGQLGTISNVAGTGLSGILRLYSPNGSGRKYLTGQAVWTTPGAALNSAFLGGFCNNTGVITGVQIAPSSGIISTGIIRIYGRKTS